jgi:hypothetical protein
MKKVNGPEGPHLSMQLRLPLSKQVAKAKLIKRITPSSPATIATTRGTSSRIAIKRKRTRRRKRKRRGLIKQPTLM